MTNPFPALAPFSRTRLDEPEVLSGPYWYELRTFLTVAKLRSISAASERLAMNRATVARHIKRAEDVVSAPLIVKSTSGVSLTEKGLELAKALTRIDHDLFVLTREISTHRSAPEGIVRLTCGEGLGLAFVTPALRAFSVRYPGVQVHLKSTVHYRSLHDNATDLMIAYAPDEHRDVASIPLGYLHLVPAVSDLYVAERGMPGDADLERHDFLDSEKYGGEGPVWEGWRAAVRRGRAKHFCDTPVTYAMMVKAGLGIGLLANYTLQETTVRRAEIDVHVVLPLYACILKDRLEWRPIQAVRDLIVSLFGEETYWFSRTLRTQAVGGYDEGFRLLFDL